MISNKNPTSQWHAVHFTLRSAALSILNQQHDYTATNAMNIMYLLIRA